MHWTEDEKTLIKPKMSTAEVLLRILGAIWAVFLWYSAIQWWIS